MGVASRRVPLLAADAGQKLSGSSQAALGWSTRQDMNVTGCAGKSKLPGTCVSGPMLHNCLCLNPAPDACCLALTDSPSAFVWLQDYLALDCCTASMFCDINADYSWANEFFG